MADNDDDLTLAELPDAEGAPQMHDDRDAGLSHRPRESARAVRAAASPVDRPGPP